MKTIKGNLSQFKVETKSSGINGDKAYYQTFKIDKTKVEITTNNTIDAINGDLVIVAGVDSFDDVFKAYSFRNLT